ncbi:MAG: type ISP restriction/modification enzyme [Desulfococcaceae bacterium]
MSKTLIQEYYKRLEKIIQHGGTRNETAIRSAFYILLNAYCEARNFELVTELGQKGSKKRPDGTIKDALRLEWGFWESKDEYDDLDAEIKAKFDRGYPKDNILFEDSQRAVLFQNGRKVMDVSMRSPEKLDEIINRLLRYERPEIRTFREAIEQFKTDMPTVLNTLREKIAEESLRNPDFQNGRDAFLKLCRDAINPQIAPDDVREMMIQHILTEEIFLSVFSESQFHRENNIARELQKVVTTFFTGSVKRNILGNIENYYLVIRRHAASIANHHEKQKFLKVLSENFYRVYNPKSADRLGVFYTPDEIVRFMIESTDFLLDKYFGRLLGDSGVHILDPAAGTGTFVTELIEHIPKAQLPHKYAHEIHCNEVSILPYYIANLNIEFTYRQKMGQYAEFENLCFMDTLEHTVFNGKQYDMFSMTVENTKRIRQQNQCEIFVIMGNPPYNANQMNENENNKNREYPGIDARIKATYIAQSTAQKTKLYDMYARFLRWATERLHNSRNGMIAFVSNNSFVNARTYDGFRKVVAEEFNEIYIIDLKGNARTSGERRRQEGGNVFSDKIRVGVAVYFLIKKHGESGCRIWYTAVEDYLKSDKKKEFLSCNRFMDLNFQHIIPDRDHNWIHLTDNDFDTLLPLAAKETKLAKEKDDEKAVFRLFSLGIVSARDEWVYDFCENSVEKKVKYLINNYNQHVKKYSSLKRKRPAGKFVDYKIKWTRAVKKDLEKGRLYEFDKNLIIDTLYRPFVKKKLYFSKELNEMQYQQNRVFGINRSNQAITFVAGSRLSFSVLVTNAVLNYSVYSLDPAQCLPLYRYDENGDRIDNITDWGLQQFVNNYNDATVSKEDIFYYVYAVLHNPAYRKKYEQNLKRELPRIPFYEDFQQWAAWGKELMNLHISFESIDPYPLERKDIPDKSPKPKLKADRDKGAIVIDTATSLHGVPKSAWEYRLGTYCALQWILDQYKEKKIKDSTVAEKFGTYRFSDYKEKVIDLLMRVCTVSVRTVEIVNEMEKLS